MIHAGLGSEVGSGLDLLRGNELSIGSKCYWVKDRTPRTACEDGCEGAGAPLRCVRSALPGAAVRD